MRNSYYIFEEKFQIKFIEYREAIIPSVAGEDYKQDERSSAQFKCARIQTNEIIYNGTHHFLQRKTYYFQRCKQCYKQGISMEILVRQCLNP